MKTAVLPGLVPVIHKTVIVLIAVVFPFYQASLMYMYIFVSLVFLLKRRLQAALQLLRQVV